LKSKLVIWFAACLALSILSFPKVWTKLSQWLSPEGLRYHGVFHWGVLGLCLLWLWLKRKDISSKIQASRFSPPFVLIGAVLVVLSLLLPRSDDFLVFLMLLGWLGVFIVIFSQAYFIPSILLAIYGFSLVFPVLTTGWLGEPSAEFIASVVTAITRGLGLPVVRQGLTLHFNSAGGNVVSTTLVPGCAGYATIGVFIALFALMMLDIRLPLKRAWYVFLIGLVGTCLQNIVRIELSLVAGYYWGFGGLEAMHYNSSYVIFPLWYALFAYIYLRQVKPEAPACCA